MGKTEDLKNKTAERTDQAEHAVEENVDKMEHSKVGKKIPTSIDHVDFKHVIYGTLVMVLFSTIPIYLFLSAAIQARPETETFKINLFKAIKMTLMIVGIFGVFFDALIIAIKRKALFKVTLLLKCLKVCIVVISILIVKLDSALSKGLFITYAASTIALDLIFVYYASIYFKRIDSDKFDSEGNPKRQEETEKV